MNINSLPVEGALVRFPCNPIGTQPDTCIMKTKLTLFVTVMAAALFGMGCASTQGVVLDKTVTPVSNRILFSSPRDGTHNIHTMNADGTDPKTVLNSTPFHDWGGAGHRMVGTLHFCEE